MDKELLARNLINETASHPRLDDDELDALVRSQIHRPDVQQMLDAMRDKTGVIYAERLDGLTFAQLGERHNRCRERMRQIVMLARRMLNHPVRMRILRGEWRPLEDHQPSN